MPLAKLTLEIEVPHAQSLKDRRQVVRSLKDSLRNSFNISVAETDGALLWNLATLEIAAVSGSLSYLTGQLHAVERAATRHAARFGASVIAASAEVFADGDGDDLPPAGDSCSRDDSSPSTPEDL